MLGRMAEEHVTVLVASWQEQQLSLPRVISLCKSGCSMQYTASQQQRERWSSCVADCMSMGHPWSHNTDRALLADSLRGSADIIAGHQACPTHQMLYWQPAAAVTSKQLAPMPMLWRSACMALQLRLDSWMIMNRWRNPRRLVGCPCGTCC